MDDKMRSEVRKAAERIINKGIPFEDNLTVKSPTEYTVRGVPELQFGTEDVDEAVENFTGGQSFDEYFNFLVDKKDLAGLERFYDWCSQKGREMLSTTHVDKEVRRVWLEYVGRLDDEVERLKEEIL